MADKIDGAMFRDAELGGIVDEEQRTVRISFSSELPVLRASWFEDPWVEILGHNDGEANLQRLNNGATVHYNHSRSRRDRVGVVEMAALKDSRGEAIVRFSKREDVDDVWQDVKDGVLRNVSVGYSIDRRELVKESQTKGEPSEYRVTRWTPMEISFVDIPADPTVGVGRDGEGRVDATRDAAYHITPINTEEHDMDNEQTRDSAADQTDTGVQQTQTREPDPAALEAAQQRGVEEGRRLENERRAGITAVVEPFHNQLGEEYRSFLDGLLDKGDVTPDQARQLLLDKLGETTTPAGGDARVTETAGEKFRAACGIAMELRAGIAKGDTPEEQRVLADEVRGYSLFEMARRQLELDGQGTHRLSRMDLVARAFTSSDFPLILADVANKAMLKGFDESPETWSMWAQTGNLSDFKIGRRVNLSSFDDLQLVNENGEFKYGTFTEQGETIQLATYGKLFSLSRQAIINDDLSAFTMIPQRMGRAASRVVGDLAYGVITSNPLLTDGIALFDAAHNNLNSGGAAAITAVSVAAARNAMALQTDANNSATGLNIRPSIFLVPLALEDTAGVLMASETDPVSVNSRVPNPVRNLATVVSDPRLDADSVTRWYLAASQQFDTIEVAFLDGVQAPTLEQQMGWTVDGTEFKVRIDVGVAPMEFRTWQRNDGV